MRNKSIILTALITVVLAISAVGCVMNATATAIYPAAATTVTVTEPAIKVPATTYSPDEGENTGDMIIVIGGGYADPVTNVTQNQKFEWINLDHEAHTVTATGQYAGLFDFTLQPGQEVDYVLKNADTYEYYDKLHPSESAVIIVDLGTD